MSGTAITAAATDSLKAEVSPIKAKAEAMIINTTADVELARDFIKAIKERRAKIDETFDKNIKDAHLLHKGLVATKKTFTDVLDDSEKTVKMKIGGHQLKCEQEAREAAEKARKEFEADQQRKIEAYRKRIDATLAKAGTIQEKVAALEAQLSGADMMEGIEQTLIERQLEVLRLQLQGLEDKALEAQQKAEEVAETPAYIPPAAVVEKTAGVSSKKVYNIVNIDATVLIKAIASGKFPVNLVKAWDETMIKKFAGLGIFCDGVSFEETRAISVR